MTVNLYFPFRYGSSEPDCGFQRRSGQSGSADEERREGYRGTGTADVPGCPGSSQYPESVL